MNEQDLVKANRIMKDIETLEAECQYLEPAYSSHKFSGWRIHRLLGKPTEKTYRGFFSTEKLDSVGSVIVVTPDEAEVLRELKLNKIDLLRKELDSL